MTQQHTEDMATPSIIEISDNCKGKQMKTQDNLSSDEMAIDLGTPPAAGECQKVTRTNQESNGPPSEKQDDELTGETHDEMQEKTDRTKVSVQEWGGGTTSRSEKVPTMETSNDTPKPSKKQRTDKDRNLKRERTRSKTRHGLTPRM
jgi:hypothetical protein